MFSLSVPVESPGATVRLLLLQHPRRFAHRRLLHRDCISPVRMHARERLLDRSCRRESGTDTPALAWPLRIATLGASGSFRGFLDSRRSPDPWLSKSHPEPGPLSSTGVNQLHRYYEPLRLLRALRFFGCMQVYLHYPQVSRVS